MFGGRGLDFPHATLIYNLIFFSIVDLTTGMFTTTNAQWPQQRYFYDYIIISVGTNYYSFPYYYSASRYRSRHSRMDQLQFVEDSLRQTISLQLF